MTIRALTLLSVMAAATPARAGTIQLVPTCVTVDDSKDALSSLERAQATTMLRHVLEEQDMLVVDSGCVDTYTLFHVYDAGALIAHVRGPHGGRKLRVAGMSELPAAYERMVRSLREPAPEPTAAPAPAPTAPAAPSPVADPAITEAPAATTETAPPADLDEPEGTTPMAVVPPAAEAPPSDAEPVADDTTPRRHNIFYGQLGAAGVGGADPARSFALGYRYEATGTVIDAAFTGFGSGTGIKSVGGERVAAKILRELVPDQASSLYIGGGLGVSSSTIQLDYSAYSGSGLEGVGTVGIDLLRDNPSLRMFLQADVILPFYMLQSNMTSETEYSATFMVSLGLGFSAGR